MKTIFAVIALVTLVGGTAQAERYSKVDGNKLISLCTSRDKSVVADCTSYIEGVSDSVSFYQDVRPVDGSKGGKLPAYVCVPTATTGVQMRETVVSWAKANPDKLGLQASGVVIRALHAAFKCRGTEGGLGS